MDVKTLVEQADTIRFEQFTVTLHGIGPYSGPQSMLHPCIPKKPGELTFTMNTVRDLGLKQPYDINIAFVGTYLGAINGAEVIRWDVAPIDIQFQVQGHNVHIDSVVGGFHSRLEQLEHSIASVSCTGTPTALTVVWTAFRDLPNNIGANGSVNVSPGIDTAFTASADDFWFIGESGVVSYEQVKVMYLRDGCGVGASSGETASFWAQLSGVAPAAVSTVKYAWTVTAGAVRIGAADQWSFRIRLDGSTSVVTVSVAVLIGAVQVTDALTFVVETPQSVRVKRLLCRIRQFEHRNFPVFPLSDPLRDLVRFPYAASDLTALIAAGEYQASVARELLAHMRVTNTDMPSAFRHLVK